MEKIRRKQKKVERSNREELLKLDKDELIAKIIQLENHNIQLRNIISKSLSEDTKSDKKDGQKPFDFSKCHYRRVLLRILYFGWDYKGFAVQEDSNQTIEHHLFRALTKTCLIQSRETSNYYRCGRTDKGVSSFGQVISISLRSKFAPEEQYTQDALLNEIPYCKLLNRLLPKDIKAIAWLPIPEDLPNYSARFDCKKRQYKYYFPQGSLCIHRMRSACHRLVGSHDFRNLCKMDVGNGVTEFIREITKADIIPVDSTTCFDRDRDPTAMYYLLIEGNAFLWHQIRCIMGVILLVGQAKELPCIIDELLDVETNPRKPQYDMALDMPLNLFHCTYELDEDKWIYNKEELAEVIAQLQMQWTLTSIQSTMILDVIKELEKKYSSLCPSETADTTSNESDKDKVLAYADCLIQGVKPKVYTKLLKRPTCTSLEEKIKYFKKRRKIGDSEETKE